MTEDLQVLIVDDDFHVGRLHAGYVDAVPGFRALPPVGSAEQALRVVHGSGPDLVLLDVYLPDALGLDLLRSLDVDVIMLTAAADAASIRKAMRRGALGYLIKPFGAGQLARKLRAYARYRRVLAEKPVLDQDTLERALHALHPGTDSGTARARSATEASVLEALEPGTAQSASEVARRVGISRATAQRYLSALADDGAIEIQLRYGSTGRPEHRYSLAPS
ncbi:response regulator [Arthrobacter mobilis]|uniref:Transcriptional regulatory protein n=1 Tax=Arthrobacter mobilis TaxID=2724944 RepID=A0A7X6HC34_9MICC|nr:response regulator [Arthrobacter mobilis]NKX53166.1 response regulator [Arthrobacter mobilis]